MNERHLESYREKVRQYRVLHYRLRSTLAPSLLNGRRLSAKQRLRCQLMLENLVELTEDLAIDLAMPSYSR